MQMKALTLWQPYAQAIAAGLKKYETRSWATNHRGLLAVHSSVRPLTAEYRALAAKYNLADLPLGRVLVICEVEDCILMDEDFIRAQPQCEIDLGDWRVGRYAWKLKVVRVLQNPTAMRGYQGLWNLDLDLE